MEFDACSAEIAAKTPTEHLAFAVDRKDPLKIHMAKFTADQERLLRQMVLRPEQFRSCTGYALAYWRTRTEALQQRSEEFKQRLPASRQGTLGQINVPLLAGVSAAIRHPDAHSVEDLVCGFPC